MHLRIAYITGNRQGQTNVFSLLWLTSNFRSDINQNVINGRKYNLRKKSPFRSKQLIIFSSMFFLRELRIRTIPERKANIILCIKKEIFND